DRVAADADDGGLAQARGGGLLDRLVGQGARARDDADLARHVDVARHDADLALARGDDARAVRADQDHVGVLLEHVLHAQHVQHRDALGDGDDDLDAGRGRLEDRVGRERRRDVDDRSIGAGGVDRLAHGVEHRQLDVGGAALAGGHAADDLGAVLHHLGGMEGALLAGEALHDHLRVLVDQNGHCLEVLEILVGCRLPGRASPACAAPLRGGPPPGSGGRPGFTPVPRTARADQAAAAAATAFLAPSLMSSAGVMARPDSASSFLPASTLVPSSRTTTGTLTSTSLTAAMMPSAIMSQRTMPPKMLTKIALTLSEDRISLNAVVTRSLVAPPPTSRKVAGSPPLSLITSMVAMARPAAVTRQPARAAR